MSKEVLIITGACGVGKTSTAKAWAKAKKGAIVECDYLTEWIFNDDFPKWNKAEEKFTTNLSFRIAFEYLKVGLPVAIENVWSPEGIELLRSKLFELKEIKVTAVWLKCDPIENHKRDEQRAPEEQMKERLDVVRDELESYEWPDNVNILDTTHLSIEEVISRIGQFT